MHRDLSSIDSRLCQIESTLSQVTAKLGKLFVPSNDKEHTDPLNVASELSTRMDRMELLLFRTSLEDLQCIDKEIEQLVPGLQSSFSDELVPDTNKQLWKIDEMEPEVESSPSKPPGLEASHFSATPHENQKLHCPCFDIFSEPDENVNQEHFMYTLQVQVQELRAKQLELEVDNPPYANSGYYEQYVELVSEKLKDKFEQYAQQPATDMTDKEFQKYFSPMHRHRVWSQLCKRFCKNTCDPMLKSELFLQLALDVDKLWHS